MAHRLTRPRLALAILAAVLVVPASALAGHVFSDVPDGQYYSDAVGWAFENGITTGTSATTFEPDANVTRGQNVTFAKRYDDKVVQPALTTLTGAVDDNAAAIAVLQSAVSALAADNPTVSTFNYDTEFEDSSVSSIWEKLRDLGSFTKINAEATVLISASGHGTVAGTFCHWQLRVDGAAQNGSTSTEPGVPSGANAVQYESGAYFLQGLFDGLAVGERTVELWVRGNAASCINNFGDFVHDVVTIEIVN